MRKLRGQSECGQQADSATSYFWRAGTTCTTGPPNGIFKSRCPYSYCHGAAGALKVVRFQLHVIAFGLHVIAGGLNCLYFALFSAYM
jgi:hypothetical protein